MKFSHRHMGRRELVIKPAIIGVALAI